MSRIFAAPRRQGLRSTGRPELARQTVEEKQSPDHLRLAHEVMGNRSVGSWIDAKLKSNGAGRAHAEAAREAGIAVPESGGQPLLGPLQAFFASRMGHDFSGVRVHTDAQAASSAQALNAKAYTAGHNIVFAAGQYAPENPAGKKLLAHELTHVVQNRRGEGAPTLRRSIESDAARIEDLLSYGLFDWAITNSEAIEALNILSRLPVDSQKDILRRINLDRLRDNLPAAYLPQLNAILKNAGAAPAEVHKAVDRIQDLLSYGLFDWAITDSDAREAFSLLMKLPPEEQKRVVLVINFDRLMDNLPDTGSKKKLAELRKAAEGASGAAIADEKKKQAETDKNEAGKKAAVQKHVEQQKNVVKLVDDGRKITPDPAKGILDRDNIFHNSVQMLDEKEISMRILTPTHDTATRYQARGKNEWAYFDSRVKYPNEGGDYPADPAVTEDNGLVAEVPNVEGSALSLGPQFSAKLRFLPGFVDIFTGDSPLSADEFRQTFVHELQHVADLHKTDENMSDWQRRFEYYKTEFRAFWVQPTEAPPPPPPPDPMGLRIAPTKIYHFGGRLIDEFASATEKAKNDIPLVVALDDCKICPPPQPQGAKSGAPKKADTAGDPTKGIKTGFGNRRQEEIFWYLISSYKERQFNCFYACVPEFRDAVNKFTVPESLNLLNSTRIYDLYEALKNIRPAMSQTDKSVNDAVDKLLALDELDWLFLKDARLSAPLWGVINGNAPPFLRDGIKRLTKLPGKPPASELSALLKAKEPK
jgi:hypothetical protein